MIDLDRTFPPDSESAKYEEEAQQYLRDVAKPRKDKLITRPPLDDPRFSEEAEIKRQAKYLGIPGAVDVREAPSFRQGSKADVIDLDAPPIDLDKPVAKATKPGVIDTVKDALTPRMTWQEFTDPHQVGSALTFGLAGGATGGIPGAIAGVVGTYMLGEVHAREREKFRKMGQSEEEANRSAAISTTVLSLLIPMAEHAVPPVPVGKFKPAPPEPTGPYSGEVGGRVPPATPQAIPYEALPAPQVRRVPSGRFVLPQAESQPPSILELAKATQPRAEGFQTARPFLYPDEAIQRHLVEGESLPTGKFQQFAEKPGFLESAEEKLARQAAQSPFYRESVTTPQVMPEDIVGPLDPRRASLQDLAQRHRERLMPVGESAMPSLSPETQMFETPGFRRTAEEMIAGRARLPEESRLLHGLDIPKYREAQIIEVPSVSQKATEGAEAGAIRARELLEKREKQRQVRIEALQYDKAKVPITARPASNVTESDGVPPVVFDGTKEDVPGFSVRLTADVWRELEMSGPLGQRAAQIARDEIDHAAERYAMQHMHKLEDLMTTWFGTSGMAKYVNPLTLPSSTKFWKISEDQVRQMVNYMYTKSGRYGEVLEPADPKVKAAADEILALVAKFNEHPGIRQATVYQIGKGNVPVGDNTPFYPHHPVSEGARKGLAGRGFELAYKQWEKKIPGLTRSDFRRMLNEADDKFRKYAGLELGRTFDATDGGTREPYQVLKELGYGVDPLKDYFSYFVGAARRGQQILAEPELVQIERAMQDAFASDQSKLNWLQGMMDRIRGVEPQLADRYFTDFVSKANNAVNLSLLQLAAPAQWNQLTYLLSRGGFTPNLKAMLSMPGWSQDKIVRDSGSLFASYIQAYTPSADIFGQQLQRMLQATSFTTSEMTLRALAAKTGDFYLQRLVKMYQGHWENPKFNALMSELHFTTEDIKRIGKFGVTMEDRLKVAQVFANETQGRTGFQGLPGWAAENGALARAILNLKRFMLSNGVEIRRQIVDAWERGVPTSTIAKRALIGLGGATVIGEVTNDIVYTLAKWDDAFSERRVPKWMRKAMGPVVGRVVQDTVTGLGSIQVALALAMFNSHADVMASFFVPVAADAVGDAWTNAWKAFQKGDYDALARYILRHTIGTTGPLGQKPEPGGTGLPKLDTGR